MSEKERRAHPSVESPDRFCFRRVRFEFMALDPLRLPDGKASNSIRGAFGLALHRTASPEEYARLFHPRSEAGPSGLSDLPRPFVLRCSHLEGLAIQGGASFAFNINFFDLSDSTIATFERAFILWESLGISPDRARVRLERTECAPVEAIVLEPEQAPMNRVAIRFVTPTELKSEGAVIRRPEFPILFARVRDRIATLGNLYGYGPLAADFAGLGERAADIRMMRCDVRWERRERKSAATGQVHPLGGFTGEAEYAGPLAEFLPWLRAAQASGVGRQTVWGKGELQVIS